MEGCPTFGTVPATPVGQYVYEPDGAVVRAHLIENLAREIGATKLGEEIAYLTSSSFLDTPFAVPYIVEESMPFSLKRLNRRLRAFDVGELIIKKRGFPVDPEQFRHRLKYGGSQRRLTLILTRVESRPTAILCRRADR